MFNGATSLAEIEVPPSVLNCTQSAEDGQQCTALIGSRCFSNSTLLKKISLPKPTLQNVTEFTASLDANSLDAPGVEVFTVGDEPLSVCWDSCGSCIPAAAKRSPIYQGKDVVTHVVGNNELGQGRATILSAGFEGCPMTAITVFSPEIVHIPKDAFKNNWFEGHLDLGDVEVVEEGAFQRSDTLFESASPYFGGLSSVSFNKVPKHIGKGAFGAGESDTAAPLLERVTFGGVPVRIFSEGCGFIPNPVFGGEYLDGTAAETGIAGRERISDTAYAHFTEGGFNKTYIYGKWRWIDENDPGYDENDPVGFGTITDAYSAESRNATFGCTKETMADVIIPRNQIIGSKAFAHVPVTRLSFREASDGIDQGSCQPGTGCSESCCIAEDALEDAGDLAEIVLHHENIGASDGFGQALRQAPNLTSLVFGDRVRNVSGTFSNVPALTHVTLGTATGDFLGTGIEFTENDAFKGSPVKHLQVNVASVGKGPGLQGTSLEVLETITFFNLVDNDLEISWPTTYEVGDQVEVLERPSYADQDLHLFEARAKAVRLREKPLDVSQYDQTYPLPNMEYWYKAKIIDVEPYASLDVETHFFTVEFAEECNMTSTAGGFGYGCPSTDYLSCANNILGKAEEPLSAEQTNRRAKGFSAQSDCPQRLAGAGTNFSGIGSPIERNGSTTRDIPSHQIRPAGYLYRTTNGLTRSDESYLNGALDNGQEPIRSNLAFLRSSRSPARVAPLIKIEDSAFQAISTLKEVVIPGNVQEVGRNAFAQCGNLTKVTLGVLDDEGYSFGAITVGDKAFEGSGALQEIVVNAPFVGGAGGLTNLPVTTISFPRVPSSRSNALSKQWMRTGPAARLLQEICRSDEQCGSVDDGVYSAGRASNYSDRPSLHADIVTPAGLGSLANYKRTMVPLITLGDGIFSNFYNLEEVTLPGNVFKIGKNVFKECEKLTKINLGTSNPEIEPFLHLKGGANGTGTETLAVWGEERYYHGLEEARIEAYRQFAEGALLFDPTPDITCHVCDITGVNYWPWAQNWKYIQEGFGMGSQIEEIRIDFVPPLHLAQKDRSGYYQPVQEDGYDTKPAFITYPEGMPFITNKANPNLPLMENIKVTNETVIDDQKGGFYFPPYASQYYAADITPGLQRQTNVKKVTIGNGLGVGRAAFAECKSLKSVKFEPDYRWYNRTEFRGGSIAKLDWRIEQYAFYFAPLEQLEMEPSCALEAQKGLAWKGIFSPKSTTYELPNTPGFRVRCSLRAIGVHAFAHSKLTEFTIPAYTGGGDYFQMPSSIDPPAEGGKGRDGLDYLSIEYGTFLGETIFRDTKGNPTGLTLMTTLDDFSVGMPATARPRDREGALASGFNSVGAGDLEFGIQPHERGSACYEFVKSADMMMENGLGFGDKRRWECNWQANYQLPGGNPALYSNQIGYEHFAGSNLVRVDFHTPYSVLYFYRLAHQPNVFSESTSLHTIRFADNYVGTFLPPSFCFGCTALKNLHLPRRGWTSTNMPGDCKVQNAQWGRNKGVWYTMAYCNHMEYISGRALMNTGLEDITFPMSITNIKFGAMRDNKQLTTVRFGEPLDDACYCLDDGDCEPAENVCVSSGSAVRGVCAHNESDAVSVRAECEHQMKTYGGGSNLNGNSYSYMGPYLSKTTPSSMNPGWEYTSNYKSLAAELPFFGCEKLSTTHWNLPVYRNGGWGMDFFGALIKDGSISKLQDLEIVFGPRVLEISSQAFLEVQFKSISFGRPFESNVEYIGPGAFAHAKITSFVVPASLFTGTPRRAMIFNHDWSDSFKHRWRGRDYMPVQPLARIFDGCGKKEISGEDISTFARKLDGDHFDYVCFKDGEDDRFFESFDYIPITIKNNITWECVQYQGYGFDETEMRCGIDGVAGGDEDFPDTYDPGADYEASGCQELQFVVFEGAPAKAGVPTTKDGKCRVGRSSMDLWQLGLADEYGLWDQNRDMAGASVMDLNRIYGPVKCLLNEGGPYAWGYPNKEHQDFMLNHDIDQSGAGCLPVDEYYAHPLFQGCPKIASVVFGEGLSGMSDNQFSTRFSTAVANNVDGSLTTVTSRSLNSSVGDTVRVWEGGAKGVVGRITAVKPGPAYDVEVNNAVLNNTILLVADGRQNMIDLSAFDKLDAIPRSAFDGASAIKKVLLGDNIASIGDRAFYGAPLETLEWGNSPLDGKRKFTQPYMIETYAQWGTRDALRRNTESAFSNKRPEKKPLNPGSVFPGIGSQTLSASNLTEITLPATLKVFSPFAFWDDTPALRLPDYADTFDSPFCSIGNTIDKDALKRLFYLDGQSNENGDRFPIEAFGSGCQSLEKFDYGGSNPTNLWGIPKDPQASAKPADYLDPIAIYGCGQAARMGGSGIYPLEVLDDQHDFYSYNAADSTFPRDLGFQILDPDLDEKDEKDFARIPLFTFANCKKLNAVVLPPKLHSIGHGAFAGTTSLTSVDLPTSTYWYSSEAFWNSGLTTLVVPSSDYKSKIFSPDPALLPGPQVGHTRVFADCKDLLSVELNGFDYRAVILNGMYNPDNAPGESYFEGCSSLQNVTLGFDFMYPANKMFKGCENLLTVTCENPNLFTTPDAASLQDPNDYKGFECGRDSNGNSFCPSNLGGYHMTGWWPAGCDTAGYLSTSCVKEGTPNTIEYVGCGFNTS